MVNRQIFSEEIKLIIRWENKPPVFVGVASFVSYSKFVYAEYSPWKTSQVSNIIILVSDSTHPQEGDISLVQILKTICPRGQIWLFAVYLSKILKLELVITQIFTKLT